MESILEMRCQVAVSEDMHTLIICQNWNFLGLREVNILTRHVTKKCVSFQNDLPMNTRERCFASYVSLKTWYKVQEWKFEYKWRNEEVEILRLLAIYLLTYTCGQNKALF